MRRRRILRSRCGEVPLSARPGQVVHGCGGLAPAAGIRQTCVRPARDLLEEAGRAARHAARRGPGPGAPPARPRAGPPAVGRPGRAPVPSRTSRGRAPRGSSPAPGSGAGEGHRSGVSRFTTRPATGMDSAREPLVEGAAPPRPSSGLGRGHQHEPHLGSGQQRAHRRRPLLEPVVHALEVLQEIAQVGERLLAGEARQRLGSVAAGELRQPQPEPPGPHRRGEKRAGGRRCPGSRGCAPGASRKSRACAVGRGVEHDEVVVALGGPARSSFSMAMYSCEPARAADICW